MQTVGDIYRWLDSIAPFETAEGFDNSGLLLGDEAATVSQVLFALDLTEDVAHEAIALGAELIITHHPLIFSPLRRIHYTDPQGRALRLLMGAGVAVIAAHTNWDKASGGVSDALASALGLTDVTCGDPYLRLGTLPQPTDVGGLSTLVQAALHAPLRVYGEATEPIRRVAVAGGAYGEGATLARELGAQAFIVGEIKHHELLDACACGLVVLDAGHFATELPGLIALQQRFLSDAAAASSGIKAHSVTRAPYMGATLLR